MKYLIICVAFILLAYKPGDDQPQFKGGNSSLNAFLKQNIVYPEYARQNCIPGTIQVSFKVDRAGKVYNIQVYKGLGIDLDDEAIRVIRLTSGQWVVPAGYNINDAIIIPIQFEPDYTRCTASNSNVSQAIDAYKNREALISAVTNFYINKRLGKADAGKEAEIEGLKQQLGFDDEFAGMMVEDARQKWKQGDKDSACEDWHFVQNIGSNKADALLAKYCGK
jgi:TonB family protein